MWVFAADLASETEDQSVTVLMFGHWHRRRGELQLKKTNAKSIRHEVAMETEKEKYDEITETKIVSTAEEDSSVGTF